MKSNKKKSIKSKNITNKKSPTIKATKLNKRQLIIAAITITVFGGAYLVYNSFAATNVDPGQVSSIVNVHRYIDGSKQCTHGANKAPTTVRQGSRGACVMVVQVAMNNWINYRSNKKNLAKFGITTLKVDGVFGAKTTTAVKAYQGNKKLKADGIVGGSTWGAIFKDCTMTFLQCKQPKGKGDSYTPTW